MEITLATLSPVFINILGSLFLLVCSTRETINRRYLALFMFNGFLLFSGHFLYFHQYIGFYHHYDFLFLFALLSYFPLYYLYTKSIFGIAILFRKHLIHFIPAVVIGISSFSLSIISDHSTFSNYFFKMIGKTEVNDLLSLGLFHIYQVARVIHLTQTALYPILIVHYLLKRMKPLQISLSKMSKKKSLVFITINSFFLLFMIFSGFITTWYGREVFAENVVILCLSGFLFSALLLMICLYGVKQIPVITSTHHESVPDNSTIVPYNAYEIRQKVLTCLNKDRPWMNPKLKISDLSVLVGTNRTYLSRMINDLLNNNFNDFINGFRVKEAASIMSENNYSTFSLKEIAAKSGFGSVSTFRRAFKKIMGESASEYHKKNSKKECLPQKELN